MMRSVHMNIIAILSTFLFVSTQSMALIPVTDVGAIANLVKNYNQLKSQYDLLKQTYSNARQQLNHTKALVRDAEGHYGFGQLFNSASDFKSRNWSPDTWQRALQGLSGGNVERYQELVAIYKKRHPTLSMQDYEKGATKAKAQQYLQDIKVNRATMINATYAFNTIKKHLATIHALSKNIDASENTKAALDLNARLMTEMAYLQTQELKMQILINQQMAQSEADRLFRETMNAKFNTLPTG